MLSEKPSLEQIIKAFFQEDELEAIGRGRARELLCQKKIEERIKGKQVPEFLLTLFLTVAGARCFRETARSTE